MAIVDHCFVSSVENPKHPVLKIHVQVQRIERDMGITAFVATYPINLPFKKNREGLFTVRCAVTSGSVFIIGRICLNFARKTRRYWYLVNYFLAHSNMSDKLKKKPSCTKEEEEILKKTLGQFDEEITADPLTLEESIDTASIKDRTFLLHVLIETLCCILEKDEEKRKKLFNNLYKNFEANNVINLKHKVKDLERELTNKEQEFLEREKASTQKLQVQEKRLEEMEKRLEEMEKRLEEMEQKFEVQIEKMVKELNSKEHLIQKLSEEVRLLKERMN